MKSSAIGKTSPSLFRIAGGLFGCFDENFLPALNQRIEDMPTEASPRRVEAKKLLTKAQQMTRPLLQRSSISLGVGSLPILIVVRTGSRPRTPLDHIPDSTRSSATSLFRYRRQKCLPSEDASPCGFCYLPFWLSISTSWKLI